LYLLFIAGGGSGAGQRGDVGRDEVVGLPRLGSAKAGAASAKCASAGAATTGAAGAAATSGLLPGRTPPPSRDAGAAAGAGGALGSRRLRRVDQEALDTRRAPRRDGRCQKPGTPSPRSPPRRTAAPCSTTAGAGSMTTGFGHASAPATGSYGLGARRPGATSEDRARDSSSWLDDGLGAARGRPSEHAPRAGRHPEIRGGGRLALDHPLGGRGVGRVRAPARGAACRRPRSCGTGSSR
jgi:hypothetical protein